MLHEIRRRAQTAAASISARLHHSRRASLEGGPRRLESRELMPVGQNEPAVVIGDAPRRPWDSSFSLMEPNGTSVDAQHGGASAAF